MTTILLRVLVALAGLSACYSAILDDATTYRPEDFFREGDRVRFARESGLKSINVEFNKTSFEGVRSEAIVKVIVARRFDLEQSTRCYGTLISPIHVTLPCSCIAYLGSKKDDITPWDHIAQTSTAAPLIIVGTDYISLVQMSLEYTIDPVRYNIESVVIHPFCNSHFLVDIAVLTMRNPIPFTRVAWVHTAENLLFNMNLQRVIAAQAVTGKCTVPIYLRTRVDPTGGPTVLRTQYIQVNFQHWPACRENVCPLLQRPPGTLREPITMSTRCDNKLAGTRFCITWTLPGPLCSIATGTPVFCDVGNIHGLMGFVIKRTYFCPPYRARNVVIQGFNDAIGWARGILNVRNAPNYEQLIPDWIKNERVNYEYSVTTKPLVFGCVGDSCDNFDFDLYRGEKWKAIFNVYLERYGEWKLACRGTLVHPKTLVLPCSCITMPRPRLTNQQVYKEHGFARIMNMSMIRVINMIDDMAQQNWTKQYSTVKDFLLHGMCDNHYEFDYAYLNLTAEVPGTKIAWIQTTEADTFKRLLKHLLPADLIEGDCHIIEPTLTMEAGRKKYVGVPRRVRFEHWNLCVKTVCSYLNSSMIYGRCFNEVGNQEYANGTRFCVRTVDESKLCDVLSGTPVFCNVEEARGFIGYISSSWTFCSPEGDPTTAVFFGINEFVKVFGHITGMGRLESYLKQLRNQTMIKRSSTERPTLSHLVALGVSLFSLLWLQFNSFDFNI